jgi:hypothetical protein
MLTTLLAVLLVGSVIGGIGGPRPVAAQASVGISAVQPAYDGNYAPGRWLPVTVGVRNDGPATSVTVAAALPNATGRNTLTLELAGGAQVQVPLLVAMDRQARSIQITLENAAGQALDEERVEVRPREGERLLGVAALNPPALSLPLREDLIALPFLSFPLNPADLPTNPAGLSSLALLLLTDAVTAEIDPRRRDSLLAWVRGGGHLILGGGSGAAATIAGLPPDLVPAVVGALTTLDPAPLAEYADAPVLAQFEGVTLSPAPDARPFGAAAAPLWVERDVGLGRVTQLAFDPGLRSVSAWPGAPALWDRLLVPAQLYGSGPSVEATPDGLREQIMSGALANLPAINLPASGPLFALLALYAIVVGPGVALLLRRMDRQELGWIVLPLVALLIGAAGSGIALTRRADQRIVSQISLVEQISPDAARARTTLGIVAPRAETFPLELGAATLLRQVQAGSAAFGPINGVPGDLPQEAATAELPIAAWELQGVLAEELTSLPALDARLELSATAIRAVVRNTTGSPLRDVIVVFAGQAVSLGNLAPDAQAEANWPPPLPLRETPRALNTPVSQLVLGEELSAGRGIGGRIERELLIREALINAAVARGNLGDEPGPFVFAWLDTDPLALNITAPGAARQQVTLLVNRPILGGTGAVSVPSGWMRLVPAPEQTVCNSSASGRGVIASPAPVVLTLRLPNDLAGLRADVLSLDLDSERPWPTAGVRVELYNAATQTWEAPPASYDGPGELTLANAGALVANGQALVRLSGRIDEAGCLFVAARVSGTLP